MNNYTEKLLGLKDVILENVTDTDTEKQIHISMKRRVHYCPCCNLPTTTVHDYRLQKVKDIPAFGLHTVLYLRKRRYACPSCGKRFAEEVPFLPKYQRTTSRLWMYVLDQLKSSHSMKSIAERASLSPTAIARMLDCVSYSLKTLPSALSIDEFKGNADGEKYQCILTNPKKKEVLDILPDRKQETLCAYFGRFKNRNQVQYVSMDMSGPFRAMAGICFPNAEIIADKFHVVRQATWAFENVRKRVQKEFHRDRRRYFKHSRRLLLKRPEKLTPDQLEQVSLMLSLSRELAVAYHLKNEFYRFMDSKDETEARKRLKSWMLMAGVADIPEFNKCIETFSNWTQEILNAFKTGLTNGYTEGCNNRIKVIKRNAYGIRSFRRLRKRILHAMS